MPLRSVADENLEAVFWQVIEELRTVHPDREIKVEMAIEKPLFCDSARVAQLLSNLLGNALTHGASGAPVDVSIQSADGDLTIEITNSGEVIPRHKLAGLFHPFARGAQSPQDGLGLGLYIASEIAKAHGGTLNASSTEKATVFTAHLPCGSIAQSEEAA